MTNRQKKRAEPPEIIVFLGSPARFSARKFRFSQ